MGPFFLPFPLCFFVFLPWARQSLPILFTPARSRSPRWRSKPRCCRGGLFWPRSCSAAPVLLRSEEHTSELQSRGHLVCRLLLEKKNNTKAQRHSDILVNSL